VHWLRVASEQDQIAAVLASLKPCVPLADKVSTSNWCPTVLHPVSFQQMQGASQTIVLVSNAHCDGTKCLCLIQVHAQKVAAAAHTLRLHHGSQVTPVQANKKDVC
jgi:hypothetical protein